MIMEVVLKKFKSKIKSNWFIHLLYFAGLHCYKKTLHNGKYEYRLSWPLLVYALVLFAGFAMCLTELWPVMNCRLFLTISCCAILWLEALVFGHRYERVVTELNQFEEIGRFDFQNQNHKVCFLSTVVVLVLIDMALVSLRTVMTFSKIPISTMYVFSVTTLYYCKLCHVLLKFGSTARQINESIVTPQFLELTLKKKCLLRLELEEYFISAGSAIEGPLLLNICCYVMIFANPYAINDWLDFRTLTGIPVRLLLLVVETLKLLLLPKLCNDIGDAFSHTWDVINNTLGDTDREDMKSRVLEISRSNRVNIGPFGLFVVDNAFVFMVITVCIKYAMVLLQFASTNDSPLRTE